MNTQQWANIGDDEGAPHALLHRVADHIPVALIDYIWIFPTRRIAIGESIVLVIGAFAADTARRRVITAHFTIARSRKGQAFVNARFDEHGSAPLNALTRVVDGVVRRLGESADEPPREERIGGERPRWDALVVALGGRPRPEAAEEPPAAHPDSASGHGDAAAAAGEPRP